MVQLFGSILPLKDLYSGQILKHIKPSRTYHLLFRGFLISVVLVFFYVRPLHSPWHPFIAGDGLGYYSYLPAAFIYHDKNFEYKWFTKAHNSNYVYSAFPDPEDNLLVKFGNKRINKYYQGLSYIWMPFFMLGHLAAKLLGYNADGFSAPYQWAMGLSSLFYLLAGLFYLRKLLVLLFTSEMAALTGTASIFYGTHLYTYAIHANTLSHAYSFTFIILFLYALVSFFRYRTTYYLLPAMLFFILSVCIRPLNGLVILLVPVFMPPGFLKSFEIKGRPGLTAIATIVLAAGALLWQLIITRIQTGSFFAYTYTDEKFNFLEPKFFETLTSYHIGLFVYVPLIFISLLGIPFLSSRKRIFLPAFFFGIIFLYSCWWYWPITKRAVVDYYALPAIFLASLVSTYQYTKARLPLITLIVLSVIYFQFKNMQVRKGILDEYATYKEVFWRNFFRTEKANMYLVPPHTIIHKAEMFEDFEKGFAGNLTDSKSYSGSHSLLLDQGHYISRISESVYPATLEKPGVKKVRFSFYLFAQEGMGPVHLFIQFKRDTAVVVEVPFYLNHEDLLTDKWDFKEFGYEIVDTAVINKRTVNAIVFSAWNVDARKQLFIDDVKTEFIITDRSFETIK